MLRALQIAVLIGLASTLLWSVGCEQADCDPAANDCPDGQVCTDSGSCQVIACNSSLDCPIEAWCNASNGQCEQGCLNDRDCLPTHLCDQEEKTCYEPGCRNTDLDCDLGQFCNEVSGQCVDPGDLYCKECSSSQDCVSDNNICVIMPGSSSTYCAVDCSGGQECPRGYSCVRIRGPGDVTIGFGCIAQCWEINQGQGQ